MKHDICDIQPDVFCVPDANKMRIPFSDKLLGINAEITRKAFFGGLSAQMLNNRKLYSGNDAPSGWECYGFERCSDTTRSLCGSPFVILHNGNMTQTSSVIALRKGKTYEAKIWVKAISDVTVTFGVTGQEERFTLTPDEDMYRELAFVFDGSDMDNGTFSIYADGDLAVFEASLLPTDHFYGMRRDVIEHLKTIAPTSVRFPGGCAADHFDWKESLKAPEFRVPIDGSSKSWFLLRDTFDQDAFDIGLNEFIMLCRELHAEPQYTVSILLSDGEDARKLAEYCNGSADTEYGAKRETLGFDAFHIPVWYIGNEVSLFGEAYKEDGVATAKRTNEITRALRAVDSSITTVVSTSWGDADRKWMQDLLENLDTPHDYLSYHEYTDFLVVGETQGEPDEKTCERLEELFINTTLEHLDYYKNGLPDGCFTRMKVIADEWNFAWGHDSSNAMLFSNALQFHFFAKNQAHYRIDRAQFFLPVNEGMITVHGAESVLESSGELFRLLHSHIGGDIIACKADTNDLDLLCTEHPDGHLYLSVVNRRSTPRRLSVKGYVPVDMTEIRTDEYSFSCNNFSVCDADEPIVSGHSVLFLTLKKKA